MIEITLTPDEMIAAASVGCHRNISCLRAGSPDKNFPDPEGRRWGQHVEAAGAEIAAARWRNTYWWALAGPSASSDVGSFQVRHTPHPDGHLVLRQRDADEAYFVLVVGRMPRLKIIGWIQGVDGKTSRYESKNQRDARSFWMVPQEALTPIGPLERMSA